MVGFFKITRKTFVISVFCALNNIQAQNILYNGSFETSTVCPDEPASLKYCKYWSIPNSASPDLYKRCKHKLSYFDIPYNSMGHQEPSTGNAYAGIVLFTVDDEHINFREYIQGELIEELESGSPYSVTLYLSWAEYSNYFCDRLGFLFTTKKIVKEPINQIDNSKRTKRKTTSSHQPSNMILPISQGYVPLSIDSFIDRGSWHKVEFSYLAKGGEKYLILGLFGDNMDEATYQVNISKIYGKNYGNKGKMAYFYIDDISVKKKDYVHH